MPGRVSAQPAETPDRLGRCGPADVLAVTGCCSWRRGDRVDVPRVGLAALVVHAHGPAGGGVSSTGFSVVRFHRIGTECVEVANGAGVHVPSATGRDLAGVTLDSGGAVLVVR